ncbi:hypothetical protein KL911_000691 [Ogataea haglerorum]|uniref:uncharacterized protein n=1 Tax=Ogataea haglerorum TaxID=1937702 RepID=UPI001C88EEF1|nr:uncharacterized protein KL911_000691 [Ogataea haglerorum]KAG7693427.1 hypothetical protein KL951_004448 [Ogataea haglerorum]KAG7750284.1 hypothetical protein KL912_000844 [Ogataea haglerorum]KAG7757715.1 hypothetical protein KL911_000691 [Ogataea haglerorum]KAG7787109.1 hypothetical protein KL910_003771 [Ogataea haglerorum]KAG7788814.1 hypothetical protein KL945_002253 [Ogataea haglerorum]
MLPHDTSLNPLCLVLRVTLRFFKCLGSFHVFRDQAYFESIRTFDKIQHLSSLMLPGDYVMGKLGIHKMRRRPARPGQLTIVSLKLPFMPEMRLPKPPKTPEYASFEDAELLSAERVKVNGPMNFSTGYTEADYELALSTFNDIVRHFKIPNQYLMEPATDYIDYLRCTIKEAHKAENKLFKFSRLKKTLSLKSMRKDYSKIQMSRNMDFLASVFIISCEKGHLIEKLTQELEKSDIKPLKDKIQQHFVVFKDRLMCLNNNPGIFFEVSTPLTNFARHCLETRNLIFTNSPASRSSLVEFWTTSLKEYSMVIDKRDWTKANDNYCFGNNSELRKFIESSPTKEEIEFATESELDTTTDKSLTQVPHLPLMECPHNTSLPVQQNLQQELEVQEISTDQSTDDASLQSTESVPYLLESGRSRNTEKSHHIDTDDTTEGSITDYEECVPQQDISYRFDITSTPLKSHRPLSAERVEDLAFPEKIDRFEKMAGRSSGENVLLEKQENRNDISVDETTILSETVRLQRVKLSEPDIQKAEMLRHTLQQLNLKRKPSDPQLHESRNLSVKERFGLFLDSQYRELSNTSEFRYQIITPQRLYEHLSGREGRRWDALPMKEKDAYYLAFKRHYAELVNQGERYDRRLVSLVAEVCSELE